MTTFFTMSYIAVVNPDILSRAGLPFSAVMTGTVVVAALSSICMGLVARLPYALAPGMGLNAYFTYSLVLGEKLSPQQALTAVVMSGVLFVLISATAARTAIARAFPDSLRRGAAAGIGIFLAFIGFTNAGVVVDNAATLVGPGPLTGTVGLFAVGLLVTALLLYREVRGALLVGILFVTLLAFLLGRIEAPKELVSAPDFSLFFAFDFRGIWSSVLIAPILTLLVTDLLDSISTLLSVSHASGLVDQRGEPLRLERALLVDACATLFSGLAGTSPATVYIESASGIRSGGRTGLTAVVAGLCFLPLLFLAPLAKIIPSYATAPTLVVVGVLMISSLREIPEDLSEAVPMFLIIALIPLTFSITQGVVFGILSYLLLRTLCGHARAIPPALWATGGLALATLLADHFA